MTSIRANNRASGKSDSIDLEILLVEDQRSLAIMVAKMLHERGGFRVLIATSLEQVRQIVEGKLHNFFVAISDLNLPDAPDGEVIDVLVGAKIPVIAVTGMFDRDMLDKIMRKGAIDYVLKNSINAYEYIVELVVRLHKNKDTKVLVVDDSAGFCLMLQRMLKMQFLEVVTASNGTAALSMLEQKNDIKLVLVDYEMPGMDGASFLAAVRRKLGKDRLAVIGISGIEDKQISAQFLKLGANDFIAKPFTYEELTYRVRQNLEMQETIEAMRRVAYHDYLTGLLNRRAFFELGGKLHDNAVRAGKPLLVAMMDIDFFKKINDIHGHDGGDAALRHISALLEQHFGNDLVARFGGEEFVLLSADMDQAIERCEAFRLHVEQSPARFGDKIIPFTISIGIASQLQSKLDASLKLADDNLYKAKKTGRNRVVSA